MSKEIKMIINFSPIRCDEKPVFERHGEVLLIDAEPFDFSPIPEGGILPAAAIQSKWICGDVSRKDGVLHITVQLSLAADAVDAARFPEPVQVTQDGRIELPNQVSTAFDRKVGQA
jgi:hypothetical protein